MNPSEKTFWFHAACSYQPGYPPNRIRVFDIIPVQWVTVDPSILLIRLSRCLGWSESSPHAKPHCWFSQVEDYSICIYKTRYFHYLSTLSHRRLRRHIVFRVGPVSVGVAFCLALTCETSDGFDQTWTYTYLGQPKDMVRFWWHWPLFSRSPGSNNRFEQKARFGPNWLSTCNIIARALRTDYNLMALSSRPNFQGRQGNKTLLKGLVSIISSEPMARFWPNWHK